MAGEPKVKIPISLPAGDMSGADQAVDKIDSVKQKALDAEREAQQLADVTAAQVKRDRREAEEFAELEKENAAFERQQAREAKQAAQDLVAARVAVGVAIATAAKQAAEMAATALKDFRDLGGELTSVQVALLETAEFAQSPFRTLVEWITGTEEALKDLAQSNANAAKQEASYLETLKRHEEELAEATRKRVALIKASARQEIDEDTAAYERQLRVITALNEAKEADAQRRDQQAIRGGADPDQVAAGAAARQAAGDAGAADQNVVEAERKLADAETLLRAATAALVASTGSSAEERLKLSEEVDAAAAAVRDSVAEVETVRVEAQAAKTAIAAEAATQILGIADDGAEKFKASAEEAKALLEAEAKEQGEKFGAGGKEALRLLTEALADKVITPEEFAKVSTAIAQVHNSQATHNAEVLKGFGQMEKNFDAALSLMRESNARNAAYEQEFEKLRQQMR